MRASTVLSHRPQIFDRGRLVDVLFSERRDMAAAKPSAPIAASVCWTAKPRARNRSGLVALLHWLGMEHRKPKAVSIKLHPDKQVAFIQKYENLLNHIGDDEAVLFGDAVRPRRVLGPKELPVAVSQSSCRQRLNIHDASDLETGKTDQPCGKAFLRLHRRAQQG